jgi:hypothetical protein
MRKIFENPLAAKTNPATLAALQPGAVEVGSAG